MAVLQWTQFRTVPYRNAVCSKGCSSCTARGNISFTYDAKGDVLSRTDELGHTTTYTYDSNGNLLTVTAPITNSSSATMANGGCRGRVPAIRIVSTIS
jgi:YD repeat-containing protein